MPLKFEKLQAGEFEDGFSEKKNRTSVGEKKTKAVEVWEYLSQWLT